jgi:prolyl-tRNA editing enzyme YbaK/EbsC (Cys-tRNA(Pro) deacylase)
MDDLQHGPAPQDLAVVEAPSEAAVQTVQAALDRSGLGLQVIRLSQSARTAREAACALGCPKGAIVKSLVLRGRKTGNAYLAEVSGAHRVNLDLLAQAAGEGMAMAAPDFVFSRTGFSVGGVAPVGLSKPVEIFIDEALSAYREIWAAAGSDRAMFRLTPSQLVQLTGGKTVRMSDPE